MKIKSRNQIRPGLQPLLEKYHEGINTDQVSNLQVKVYDNQPEAAPGYEPGRYKTMWEIWLKGNDTPTSDIKLANKLSKFKTFKNTMYTNSHRQWYVKCVDDIRNYNLQMNELDSKSLTLACAMGTCMNGQPILRVPKWAGAFTFDGAKCIGYLHIEDHVFLFEPNEMEPEIFELDYQGKRVKRRMWQTGWSFE
jgi:hypothetical protein